MAEPRILVIIPAHNEAHSLAAVIGEVRAAVRCDIVVVDDGSSDGTAAVARGLGAEVLVLPFNLGIGATMQTGYQFADRGGYDVAVQVDGDGQHDPTQLDKILSPILRGECDIAVGSRYLDDSVYEGGAPRRMGTAVFSRMLSLLIGQRLTDATSGFRAVDRRVIELFAHDYPRDYPEVEALLTVHKERLRTLEVPVKMRPRGGGSSSINTFRSVYYMVKVLLALLVTATRKRAPRVE